MTTTITDDPVRQAEQEAAEAERLALAIAERVRSGEDVDPAELTNAEQLARFAKLRVEAARRQVAQAREAARQGQLAELAAEIRDHDTDPTTFCELLGAVETALTAFAQACADRNTTVSDYRVRMMRLGVPNIDYQGDKVIPPAEHAHLGYTRTGLLGQKRVVAAERRLNEVDPAPIIAAVIHRLAHRFELTNSDLRSLPDFVGIRDPIELHEYLRRYA